MIYISAWHWLSQSMIYPENVALQKQNLGNFSFVFYYTAITQRSVTISNLIFTWALVRACHSPVIFSWLDESVNKKILLFMFIYVHPIS